MKRCLHFILFGLLAVNTTLGQVLLNNRNTYSLDGNVFLLEEAGKPLAIQEVWKSYQQKKFTFHSTPTNSVNLGFVKNVYWIAVPVKNILNNNQSIKAGIPNNSIFRLEFYLLSDSGGLINHYITGARYDFFSRPVINRHYYFPASLQARSSAVIFYRIDMRGNGFDIPLELVKKDYIDHKEWNTSLFYAFFSGWMVFVAFLSLVTYLWTKDKIYIFYSAYVTSGWLFFLGDGNYDFEFLYPHWPALASISPTIYALFVCFFMLLFMSDFLHLKPTSGKLFVLSRVWSLLLVFTIIFLVLAYIIFENIVLRTFFFYYCLISIGGAWAIQIYCIIRRVFDRYKPAYLYGLALIFVFLSATVYVLHVLNKIPDLISSSVYIPMSFAIEIIILSFALIYNYNYHKRKHQQLSETLANEQLNFSRQLIQLQEAEQKRIAEDLHDELGGNLAAIKMNLQSLHLPDEDLSNIVIQLIDKASDNARHIAHNLMPPEFEKTKLSNLLQTFFNRLNAETNIHFHYHTSGVSDHFNKQDDLMIYRIIMELTHNIIKHSYATEATIQLIYYDAYLEMMAEDNGKGFTNVSSNGMGISNIESRVNFLQGKMNIDTSIHGTTIMIKVPYKK